MVSDITLRRRCEINDLSRDDLVRRAFTDPFDLKLWQNYFTLTSHPPRYFSYCSAAINPFVYAFRMPRFRRLLNMTGNNQGFYAGATKATVNGRKTATQYIHTPQ